MITSCKSEISVWNVGYAAAVALFNTQILTFLPRCLATTAMSQVAKRVAVS